MTRYTAIKLVAGVVLPAFAVLFVVADHTGVLDRLQGLDEVLRVAERFETSYAAGVDRRVGPDEAGWKPILNLIVAYSSAKLPNDREPIMLARWVALASAKADLGQGKIAEWTALSTPILLLFANPPQSDADFVVVGEIADLREWVERSRSNRRFFVHDIVLAVAVVMLAFVVWLAEFRAGASADPP